MKEIKVRGIPWKVKPQHTLKDPKDLGECDYNKNTIRMPYDSDTKEDLDTCLHELTHAFFPDLNEDTVEEFGAFLADYLWNNNWRQDWANLYEKNNIF